MTTQRSVVVQNAVVRCSIVNNQVKVLAVQGAASGGGGTDSTKVAKAGDTMTGLLVMQGASAAAYAAKAKVTGDTAHRLYIASGGTVGFDPTGAASSPSMQIVPVQVGTVGLLVGVFDDPSILSYGGVVAQAYRGAKPTLVLSAFGGTASSPTAIGQGGTIGELAYQAQTDTTIGHTWTSVALTSFAVENQVWTTNHGGMLVIQPVPRATGMSRIDAVKVWDSGRLELDPGNIVSLGGNWTVPDGRLRVKSQATDETTAIFKRYSAGQTAKLTEWQDDTGAVVASISPSGVGAFAASSTVGGLVVLTTGTIDTDGTLAGNSDTKVPSQKAVKTYADQLIASADAMVFKGVIDCSTNPNYPAADRGWTYRVSVAGKIGGASGVNVEAGDLLLCLTDGTASGNQATVGSAWSIAQANIDGAVVGPASATNGNVAIFSGTSGKIIADGGALGTVAALASDTDGTLAANSDSRVATQKATKTYADGMVPKSTVTTKGDLIAATGSAAVTRHAVGTDGQALVANSANADGLANAWMGQSIYGDGSDGSLSTSGNVSMAGPKFYTDLTVNNGNTITTAGYPIFCLGTLTVKAGGTITAAGGNGAAAGTAGSAAGAGFYGSNGAGGAGGTAGGTTGTSISGTAGGGAGGAGGTGAGGSGGAGGNVSLPAPTLWHAGLWRLGGYGTGGTMRTYTGGAGGGGGGGDGTAGGGGGGGGGIINIFARSVVIESTGTITAAGGNGGTPAAGNRGGGGGGGGGAVFITCDTYSNSGTVTAAGGTGGTKSGTGTNGTDGNAGTVSVLTNVV